MAFETLDFSITDDVAEITMNRPDAANAMNGQMAKELFDVACRCESQSMRAVIITGSGKFFNPGGDLSEFADAEDKADHVTRMASILHLAVTRFANLDAPVITAVNGAAGGAGFSLAMSGDIILASEKAKFISAYTASGLSPDGSSTYYIAKHIGLLRAKELMLTNRVLTAVEACNWGMVTRVLPPENLMTEARQLAAQFAQGPTKAYGKVKNLLETAYSERLETQLEQETRLISASMRTYDGVHGIESFLAKEQPKFTGK